MWKSGTKRKAPESGANGTPKDSKRRAAPWKDKKVADTVKKPSGEGKIRLTFKSRPDWHAAELPPLPTPDVTKTPPYHVVEAMKKHAMALLEAENESAGKSMSQDASHKFMSTIMTSGTLEDRVSALTLGIQESPLHGMKSFESLMVLAKKKSRNHAIMALAAVKDLLSQGLVLPADRKLRYFGKQPGLIAALQDTKDWHEGQLLPGDLKEVHLLSWAFEDWLKKIYFEIIQVLENWCNDEIEYTRTRALGFIFELLKEKPEQEENLLRLLVNKLGDKAKRVSSRASYLLLQLEQSHPNMKQIVTKAIESDVLFKDGQNPSAKYYAIITLNQTVLSSKEPELAQALLDIYFTVFRAVLSKQTGSSVNGAAPPDPSQKMNRKAKARAAEAEKAAKQFEELEEKLIAQILTGVNRAFPFADTSTSTFEAQLDTLYRITHSSNFGTSVQAMILIQMITQAKGVTADRYYRTLYESLLDPRLITSNKQVMYLNLLYKSIKSDLSVKRVQAFVKRILQILPVHEPPFACSALFLVHEISKVFPAVKTMASTAELDDEDEDEHFVDVPEDGAAPIAPTKSYTSTSTFKYDPRKRDPLHTNADHSCLWELLPIQAHFHPSVAVFAQSFLDQSKAPPKPDPTLHTLMHFLDRFVYRNAKANGAPMRGSSIMQPLAGNDAVDLLVSSRAGASAEIPLNTEAFWNKKAGEVAADEVFFHQYFAQSGKNKKKEKKKVKEDDEDDDEEGGEDAGEDEIWKALVNSRPEVEGDSDDDEEGFSDMDDLMADDAADDDGGYSDGADEDDQDVVFNMDSDGEDEEMISEDGGVEINMESDEEVAELNDEDDEAVAAADDDDDEGVFNIADLESDDDAQIGSEDELPSDVEAPVADEAKEKKGKNKKRKLKHLPLFASAEDYAKLIGDSDEEY
ncbi:CBF-domain-containing protein [Microthyrium microscopicum]|uniref:CBF-domain-containing protein n=1 Tax=Microthyrium microscopicum TaxID=703497 RepID=A0A6A6U647_9PEZI|nr:CBF-domain-containing protein [Microthyrium microscopicum]